MLSPRLITKPGAGLIDLEEAKDHPAVDDDGDDDLITSYIETAEAYLDGYTGILGRALVTQTWSISVASFDKAIRLPLAPVQEISAVTYIDPEGATQTAGSAMYSLFEDEAGPFIERIDGATPPDIASRRDAVTINFVAGYGNPEEVPAPLRTAAKMIVATLYDQRETHSATPLASVPFGVAALCAPYRRTKI